MTATRSPLAIQRLGEADTEAATALGRRAFHAPAEQPDLAYELARSIARTWVAYESDRLVGYVLGWVAADEAQLMSIAVEPSARDRGIGKALLERFLHELSREGVTSVVLEVRRGNAPARAVYERFGFEQLGERTAYYADGEDGVTYKLALAPR